MDGLEGVALQTDANDGAQTMDPGADYRIDSRPALETAESPERDFESSDYSAGGYKGQELREFRDSHEGEFTEVQSRSYPVERFGDPDSVVRDINPFYDEAGDAYKVNCADCARSVERTWRGGHEEAAGRSPRLDANGAVVPHGEKSVMTEDWAGETFTPTPDDAELHRALLDGGHGSSAIVHSSWERGAQQRAGGHAYNLVNYHGEVRVLDGQLGQNMEWQPGDIHPKLGRSPRHVAMGWNGRGERIW